MIRLAFWLVVPLALLAAFALVLQADRGYVLIVSPPWRVELSAALAVGLLILTHLGFYFLVRLLRGALRLPRELRAWRERRRQALAEGELQRAVAALLAGQHSHALKLARQALERSEAPLAALVGAQAALGLGEAEAARQLLARAEAEVGELVAARQSITRAADALASTSAQVPGPPWNSKESE
ncbi:MAG: hypothetical protein NZ524_08395 [Thiobacillaceae bacterium]|nr:hypothetical protein [Thiobacillaceae bacterium]MCX7673470.1 hypothetical protein [Thiobacillaceae bacterium]MDW8323922.1 heme biosynthesis HemY N-terminal domain-containing protein [Burkholderiales bacterium]